LSKSLCNDGIVIGYVQRGSLTLGYAQQTQKAPTLHVTKINMGSVCRISDSHVTAVVTEFPRVNDALNSLPIQSCYLPI